MAEAGPQNIQQQGGPTLQEMALQAAFTSGYYNADGTPKGPSGFNAQMMDKLFHCHLPKTKEDFDDFYELVPTVIGALARIPNISREDYNHQVRVWQDIREMSATGCWRRIVASMMMQQIFELRLLVSRGDNPLPGITGVSAIITQKNQTEQTVRMPQQQPQGGGLFGFLRRG